MSKVRCNWLSAVPARLYSMRESRSRINSNCIAPQIVETLGKRGFRQTGRPNFGLQMRIR